MSYPRNTKRWLPGDFVIHCADAKEPRMLMQVIDYEKTTGMCRTRYIFPSTQRAKWRYQTIWENDIMYLLDPADFNIDVAAV